MKKIFALLALMAVIAIAVYVYAGQDKDGRQIILKSLICQDIAVGCEIDGIFIKANQSPQMMHPFKLEVRAVEAESIYANFSMRDMDVGFSRYRLLQPNTGVWVAEVTLPVCTQSRSDWIMTLDIDKGSVLNKYQVAFETQSDHAAHHHH